MILAGRSWRDFYRGIQKPGSRKLALVEIVSCKTAVPWARWHVSRETNHGKELNKEILLAYTEISEDRVQNIFHVEAAKKPTQAMSRRPQLFRRQLLALAHHFQAALQRIRRLLQQFSLPRPADQAVLPRAQIVPRERNQGRDQLRNPVAAARRDSKIGAKPPLLPGSS